MYAGPGPAPPSPTRLSPLWISGPVPIALLPHASRADEEGEEGEVEEETVAPVTTEEKLEELNQQLREGSIGPHLVPCQNPTTNTRFHGLA